MVPKWLPPRNSSGPMRPGVGHIAAGVAILTGRAGPPRPILLTAMFASFTPLVHGRCSGQFLQLYDWTENGLNLALVAPPGSWRLARAAERHLLGEKAVVAGVRLGIAPRTS